jgi:hypothetical protein
MLNYWPVQNSAGVDVIAGANTNSSSPLFVSDRFGVLGGAFRVNSLNNIVSIPRGVSIGGDFTLTLWVCKPFIKRLRPIFSANSIASDSKCSVQKVKPHRK